MKINNKRLEYLLNAEEITWEEMTEILTWKEKAEKWDNRDVIGYYKNLDEIVERLKKRIEELRDLELIPYTPLEELQKIVGEKK